MVDPAKPGMSYAQMLQPVGGVHTWNIAVTTDQVNSDITVTWPTISTLPRNYRLTLTDTTSGQTIDLAHAASYQFNSGHNAATRSFILTASPTNRSSRALVSNITIDPGRTGGRAAGVFSIGYTISQDASVTVNVLGFNGQVIASVSPTRAVTAGDNQLSWNGRLPNGQIVPAGTYLLEVRATTADSEVTRQIQPLIVTGR
jgi:hypothetical protein